VKHFVVYPSADLATGVECGARWRAKGYEVLIGIDQGAETSGLECRGAMLVALPRPFQGYYRVINRLVSVAFQLGKADVVTCIGDDMDPPEQGAHEHAERYFSVYRDGEGVMQCTGDPQGVDDSGLPAAARICGSPTFGKGWNSCAHKSRGPFWSGYTSFFADEDLLNVSRKLWLLYQEPELSIFHRHWSWGHRACAPHNERAQLNWEADKALFEERKQLGFPDD
jgi:hypothetical protein